MKNSKVFTQEEIKEIRGRIKVSVENTGKFIRETRIQHHLSQSSLGSVLYVTKKAVSKWERGLCYPSMDVLPYLAETLGVTTDEILYAKFDTENKYEDDNKTLKLIYRIFKSKHIKNMIRIIIAFIIALLTWFYIDNYNAVKIYTLRSLDNYVHIENALLVTTKQFEYISLGYIHLDFLDIEDQSQINYTIYIGDKNYNEKMVQEFVTNKYILYINNIKNDENSNIKISDNLNKLYLDITYINKDNEVKNYTIELYSTLKYRSNDVLHIFKKINDSIINMNTFPTLGVLNNQIIETSDIDLSFLYEMSDEERKEKYNNKDITINNEKYNIKIRSQKITFLNNYLEYKIELNGNMVYFKNKMNNYQIAFTIKNKKVLYTNYDEEFLKLKNIISKLKN